jgi:outer membrane immunogenic protein
VKVSVVGIAVSVLGLVVSQSAFAADMPVKAPPAPMAVVSNWTGFYIGANFGGSVGDSELSTFNPISPGFACSLAPGAALQSTAGPFNLAQNCNDTRSVVGGGQIGYNQQFGSMVLGVEADGNWRHVTERAFKQFGNTPTAGAPMGSVAGDTSYLRSIQDEFGTVRARVGYAQSNWMVYGTGGLAVGQVRHAFTEVLNGGVCLAAPSAVCRNISDSGTQTGWTAGAGNWSVGVEYLYIDLGRTTLTLAPAGGFFTPTDTATFDDRSHIARLKLNYRWGGLAQR